MEDVCKKGDKNVDKEEDSDKKEEFKEDKNEDSDKKEDKKKEVSKFYVNKTGRLNQMAQPQFRTSTVLAIAKNFGLRRCLQLAWFSFWPFYV